MDVMNTHAQEGDKVVFADPDAGLPADRAEAGARLEVGETYIVERTEAHRWYPKVHLQGFPDIAFNIQHFKDA